ncbi:CBS domain-containing protein CBSCBSPB3-like [Iris pallida]|uniref:CBS domain-containing protein CBSCBSPB3-like n=1 Tax=Iris pallida TaxID=29817 RepID=A0AAX6H0T8_IRIPA|nr:CBS domain-containing protein CBSCBSPB3-like [Iris pallida]
MANTMMQTFWDSALAIDPPDEEYDTHSELSTVMTSEYGEPGKSGYPPLLGNSFTFKFEDSKRRVHRFNCGTESLVELVSAVKQRIGLEGDRDTIQLLYEDDEGDKVLLATDTDLIGAVNHAKLAGWKVLRLHFDSSDTIKEATRPTSDLALDQRSGSLSLTTGVMASAVALTGIGVMVYLKRANV